MGTATAGQIEPITYALLGLFAAAALVAIAVAAARHFLRKGEDASAPSGLAGRAAHVAGYIFAGALIAAGGASLAKGAKDAGGESVIQGAASAVGSENGNPFAPTESAGLEPIAGTRSELGQAVEGLVERIKAEAARGNAGEAKGGALGSVKGVAAKAEGSASVTAIKDDETAMRLLSPSDYLKYKSGVRFEAVEAADGSRIIYAVK